MHVSQLVSVVGGGVGICFSDLMKATDADTAEKCEEVAGDPNDSTAAKEKK